MLKFLLSSVLFFTIATLSFAQVSITSTTTTYTQNFNTLRATAGTSSTMPTGWRLLETGTNANTSYTSGNGSSTTGDSYSFGTGTATERALGSVRSSSNASTYGVPVRNSTGASISSVLLGFIGEQWRTGATGRTDNLDFQYSTNATSLSTGTWTDVNALDFASINTTTVGALDGNATANRTTKSATITVTVANNTTIWFRWVDADATSSDDGLAIDDVTIKLNAATADVTAPLASTFSPTNNATAIAQNGNLVITFNENIQKGTTGNIILRNVTTGVAHATTTVTSTTVTVSGATATIPFSGLAYNTIYNVEIAAGAFRDIAGNNYAGITNNTTWRFTTIPQPGTSLSANPTSINFNYVAAGATSAAQTVALTTSNVTANIQVNAPTGFVVSSDNVNYAPSITYTIAQLNNTTNLYVKFMPSVANTTYTGSIQFVGSGLNTSPITVSGTTILNTSMSHYYGNLHAHSSYSDGNADDVTKTPADDYAYAKTALCMDFLGISEHNHPAAGMNINDWAPGRAQAAAATTNSFVGLYGMEWGVISGGGHVIVYGVDSLLGWDPGQYQVFVPKSVYKGAGGLFEYINRKGQNALAYLAHPNTTDYNNLLNGTFDVAADNAIVGSTVETGPAFSTNTSYTNPGSSMAHLSYYRNMLSKGYHLGPTIDHDNHNMTFGKTAKTRLVIMASSLSENNLLQGMRKMNFYASQDCGAKITYSINGEVMGSITTKAGAPNFNISSITTSAVSSVAIMAGVPGSGTAATALYTSTTGSFTYTDNTLANLAQKYYYLDITEADGSRIITAPIWYTRNDAVRTATSISSFFVVNEKEKTTLKWTTSNKKETSYFHIYRSINGGISYQYLQQFASDINPTWNDFYALEDFSAPKSVVHYRLVQTTANGTVLYTDEQIVDRTEKAIESFVRAYPNPVTDNLTIQISSDVTQPTAVQLFDMTGRMLLNQKVNVVAGLQNTLVPMQRLQSGTYMLRIQMKDKLVTQIVVKQ